MREASSDGIADLFIIGGGINGCGIARDAAGRGLKVLLAEAGDLVQPLREGVITPQAIVGDLAELLRGQCAGRLDSHGITLFKSVGTALEDLAATRLVLRDLLDGRGAGQP